jgi:hypothetical protein
MARTLKATALGALSGGFLAMTVFIVGALLDGTRFGEAFGFGIAVGIAGALAGALVGFLVGLLRLRLLGGALAGLGLTLAAVALYVFGIGRPGQAAYFLGESLPIILVIGLPMIVTGGLTAWLMGRNARERAA